MSGVKPSAISSATVAAFKSKLGITGFTFSDGMFILPNPDNPTLNIRFGTRSGYPFACDRELTVTGFAGTIDIDWENIGGNGPA